ncbi:LAMI_0D00188g1_1 [Lachancea mirantina]|uniref:LAMI_0D00188g1_1 n=1 Tax=Lachancea mirantina TaxID=1230905 RepID=A0A1G4J8J1_9SACH|nr:LAMI_0D00188g1_1 [Lachancea mirantina]
MKILGFTLTALCAALGVHAYNSAYDLTLNRTAMNSSVGHETNRPLIHYTPRVGWMNDPNGLFFDEETSLWHVYYQYKPDALVAGLPIFWGHATSKDLTSWVDHGVAIEPADDVSGAFSGSIVIDRNNTSGFFDNSTLPGQRIVALYTEDSSSKQSQFAAYSLDGGYTFNYYAQNPVLDINSTQFRDPKVIWHDETQRWVMTLALSQEYKIQIYTSKNLKTWNFQSNFSHYGFLGYQYECPGLSKVPVLQSVDPNTTLASNNSSSVDFKWVMFLSINPGAPTGGSVNQYFIGDFDGKTFTADDSASRFVDNGKDFYAMQTFSDTPTNEVVGLAWASNWDYGAYVPITPWKTSMTLARNLTLRPYKPNPESSQLTLYSEPIIDHSILNTTQSIKKASLNLTTEESVFYHLTKTAKGLLEFTLEWKVNATAITSKKSPAAMTFNLRGIEDEEEFLKLGYEVNSGAFFLDRGISDLDFVRFNPLFTTRLVHFLEPYRIDQDGLPVYKVHGIVDKDIVELFFNDGSSTSTNTFYMSEENFLGTVELSSSVDDVFNVLNLEIKQLNTM